MITNVEQELKDQAGIRSQETATRVGEAIIDSYDSELEIRRTGQSETIEVLLERYEKPTSDGWLITFHELPEGITAYNASKVFKFGEKNHMLVREELEGDIGEFTSRLAVYECSEDGKDCYPAEISNLPELTAGKVAQDPAIAYVKGNIVVSWVEVTPNDPADPTKGSSFKSVAAVGETLDKLHILVESEDDTKGLRFVELLDHRIGVTTRTSIKGEYKMCYAIADSWEDITTEFLSKAKEIQGLEGLIVRDIDEGSSTKIWIGPNDQELLANGDVSLLFHVARFLDYGVPGNREYFVAHCVLTPGEVNDPTHAKYPKIIAKTEDFNIPTDLLRPKRSDLEQVAYPSWVGIASKEGGEAILLTALRDAGEIGQYIPDPLKEWREAHPEYANDPFSSQELLAQVA